MVKKEAEVLRLKTERKQRGRCPKKMIKEMYAEIAKKTDMHDNAVMENSWGGFKDTLRKHFRCWECDDLRSMIEQVIHYFNYDRLLQKLKGKPPVLYRTELAA